MSEQQTVLIKRLSDLHNTNDRAALATLRRSLSFPPGSWPAAFPYVEAIPQLGEGWRREVAYLVAGLYALARITPGDGNFGHAVRKLQGTTDSKSVEQRFIAILEADRDELPHRLRQMITLIRAGGFAPEWNQFYTDLLQWNHPDKYIQQRWARSFYAPRTDDATPSEKE